MTRVRTFRWGRWQLRLTLMKHDSPAGLPDRWVLQTSTVYDRKARS